MATINFELYKYFCEAAKAGNVTKAAEKLFLSQSAVSQAIMQLEDRLGCQLFNRNKRGVQMTPEGEVLFSYISNAMTLMENAQEKLSKMKNLRDGEIKIGASDTTCSLFLLPVLDEFSAKYPEIHISVINRTTQELLKLLKNGTVDISFVNLPVEDEAMLKITPVMPIQDCFVVGAKYAYLADSVFRLGDLRKYPILMLEKSSNSRKHMDAFLASYEIEIEPSIELESLALLSEFAKIGLGIAATLKEDAQKMLDSQELYELRFLETLPARHIGLAQIKNVSLSFAAEAFKKSVLATVVTDCCTSSCLI
ncbi:MAG: LysR family transcriptional regulator [Peptococcaceae bacterium]|nr:LysR family transcriptional regulator [Peptococcaceae bacterium]